MTLPRYGKYRDSGIDWVEELPTHWKSASLKWLSQRYSGGTPDKTRLEFWQDGTIPWLNSGAVNEGRIYQASAFITQQAFDNSSAKWIPPGALLMALAGQGRTKGMVAQLMFASTCNQSMAAIVPTSRIEARYLYWWLVGNYQNIRNLAGGDLRDGLNLDLLGSITCPLPLTDEQIGIAAFLDRETAKIDALIAEQEKLITLLAEKRQATISHAVTRGLNPSTPLRDTGLPWVGKLPAHWCLSRVKAVSQFTTSGPRGWSDRITEHGDLFIQSGDLTDSLGIDFASAKRVIVGDDAESLRTQLKNNDVLVCITGAKTGNVAICSSLTEAAYINQHLCLIRPLEGMHARFLATALKSNMGQTQFELSQYGLKQGLSLENVRELWVPVPPEREQSAIIEFLASETSKLDSLAKAASEGVCLLNERRAALIAAAVTGQIDVRAA